MAIESTTKEKETWFGAKYFETTISEHKGPIDNKILAREIGNTSERAQELASERYHEEYDEDDDEEDDD